MGQAGTMWVFAGVPRSHATAQRAGWVSSCERVAFLVPRGFARSMDAHNEPSRVEVLHMRSSLAADRAGLVQQGIAKEPYVDF